MASLGEMVHAAQVTQEAKNRSNPLARMTERAMAGGFAGLEERRQEEAGRMDRWMKLLDVQEKMAEIEQLRTEQRIAANTAKAMGILPAGGGEAMNTRSVMFESLGAGDGPVMNTEAGRLKNLLGKHKLTGFKLTGGKVDFSFEDPAAPKKSTRDPAARREKIMTLAGQAAQREWDAQQRETALPGQTTFGRPPQDVVNKYIPAITAFVDGDTKTYDAEMAKMLDPWGVGGGGGGLGMDLEDLDIEDEEE